MNPITRGSSSPLNHVHYRYSALMPPQVASLVATGPGQSNDVIPTLENSAKSGQRMKFGVLFPWYPPTTNGCGPLAQLHAPVQNVFMVTRSTGSNPLRGN